MTRPATIIFLGLMAVADAISARGPAARPVNQVRIDHVEIAAQYATVHFYTEPNRTYTVEAAYEFPATNWVAIYTARAFPFANHYVVADEHTNAMRFYRLYVVP
jgi:hypothetical protein